MNRYGLIRGGVIIAILNDARTLAAVKTAFADIAAFLEAIPAEAQCGWVRSGGTFIAPLPDLPVVLPKWKLKAAARDVGRTAAIATAMASAPQRVQDAWADASEIQLLGIVWRYLVQALSLNAAQQRAFWTAASEVED